MSRFWEAARKAQCDEFINKLEQGYQSSAGEAGDRLSGGERQRIAIARAILKNAPIVILDEATSFTDPENEAKIQEAIAELTRVKRFWSSPHRLSTIKNADRILLIEKGRIAQSGTHEELLESSSLIEICAGSHWRKEMVSWVKRGGFRMIRILKRLFRLMSQYKGRLYLGIALSMISNILGIVPIICGVWTIKLIS